MAKETYRSNTQRTKRTINFITAVYWPLLAFAYSIWGLIADNWNDPLIVFYVGTPLYVLAVVVIGAAKKTLHEE